jgi:predicted MFS family arabinose efflux permease
VTFIGVSGLFTANALSYLAIIGALLAMKPAPAGGPVRRASLFASIRDGYAYVWRDPVIRPLFGLMAVVAIAGRCIQQLLPAFANDALHVNVVELSWLFGAGGAGAIAGSLIGASVGDTNWRGRVLILSPVVFGATIVLFAVQRTLLPAIALMALLSCAMQVHTASHVTTYQSRAPHELQGRVIAASSTEVGTLMSVGVLVFGWLGSHTGIDVALAVGGTVLALASLWTLAFVPPLRNLGREVSW